jgi:hypothetical protein
MSPLHKVDIRTLTILYDRESKKYFLQDNEWKGTSTKVSLINFISKLLKQIGNNLINNIKKFKIKVYKKYNN